MQLECHKSDDADALFDAVQSGAVVIAAGPRPAVGVPPAPTTNSSTEVAAAEAFDVFQRIGHITRKLHDALQELGYDKKIEDAVHALPDARTRLDYIARLTGDAADKVLNAVDVLQTQQERIDAAAKVLREGLEAHASAADQVQLEKYVATFLSERDAAAAIQRHHITEIMMAQDFHDLTGQVIRKIVTLASGLEEQLVKLLLETSPPEQRAKVDSGALNGPVVSAAGRTDVVTNQAQVDDLLESLGF
jgi:chemotaxis protein CheZ